MLWIDIKSIGWIQNIFLKITQKKKKKTITKRVLNHIIWVCFGPNSLDPHLEQIELYLVILVFFFLYILFLKYFCSNFLINNDLHEVKVNYFSYLPIMM